MTGMPQVEVIASNFTRIDTGKVTIWFSYRTPIAFRVDGHEIVVRENSWNVTTGKHLNQIDGRVSKKLQKERVSGTEFKRLWQEQTGSTGDPAEVFSNAMG
jgi:hypothetical protein